MQPALQTSTGHKIKYQSFEVIAFEINARASSDNFNKIPMPDAP
jgi:hypothetical protein